MKKVITANYSSEIPPVDNVEPEAVVDEPVVEEPNFTIPPENEIVINPKVMLSTEVAVLLGKSHENVLRDIDVIVREIKSYQNLFYIEVSFFHHKKTVIRLKWQFLLTSFLCDYD